jgi:protein-disulfide isomerase
MVVFSDFQCSFCARFTRDVLPELERRYVATGRVAMVFRHLPLPIHPQAVQAAVLAECAGQQGRFWEMHDRLFAEERLTEATLDAIPGSMDLDMERLAGCVSDDAVSAGVRASAAEANALGIRGTPAFFLGRRVDDGRVQVGRVISGARPLQDFVVQLDLAIDGKPTGWRFWIPFAT